jgi:hypothetical protein
MMEVEDLVPHEGLELQFTRGTADGPQPIAASSRIKFLEP